MNLPWTVNINIVNINSYKNYISFDFKAEVLRYSLAQSIVDLASNKEEEEALKEYAEEEILNPFKRHINEKVI